MHLEIRASDPSHRGWMHSDIGRPMLLLEWVVHSVWGGNCIAECTMSMGRCGDRLSRRCSPAIQVVLPTGGREGGREGGKEGGREGRRGEGKREGEREGGREGGREIGRKRVGEGIGCKEVMGGRNGRENRTGGW